MSKYIVTDPCYILPGDTWSKCIDACEQYSRQPDWSDKFTEQIQAALSEFVGSKAWVESTGFGDWDNTLYGPDVIQSDFTADSGMVCVCEYNEKVADGLNCPEQCAAIFDANGSIKVDFDTSVSDWIVVNITDSTGNCWNTHIPDDEEDDE